MRYWKITNRVSGLVLGAYLADSEEAALDAMARDAGYTDYAHMCGVEDPDSDEFKVEPLWAVGDRVEIGDTYSEYDTGTVIAIGDEVYERRPWTREYGILSPVLVAWDSVVWTVEEALDLREEGEAPVEMEDDEEELSEAEAMEPLRVRARGRTHEEID